MITVNAKKLVNDFGGLTATARGLVEVGLPTTKNAVDQWRRVKRVPTESLCGFALLARQKNQRFDLLDYIIVEE